MTSNHPRPDTAQSRRTSFPVHFLAAAIVVADPEIFIEFLDWLQVLLDNRGAPPRSLISGLDTLDPALEAVDASAAQLIDPGRNVSCWSR
jgi:hypothetical protein